MRVICIDAKPKEGFTTNLKEGEIYNARPVMVGEVEGFACEGVHPFEIQQNPCLIFVFKGANKNRFAILSERDEKDLAHAEPIESTFILKEHV